MEGKYLTNLQTMVKVNVRRWHGVAAWKWGIEDNCCGICRMPYEACCPGVKYPGDDCAPMWGECGHAFHLQCVMRWLESQQNQKQECPMCRAVWKFRGDAENINEEGEEDSEN